MNNLTGESFPADRLSRTASGRAAPSRANGRATEGSKDWDPGNSGGLSWAASWSTLQGIASAVLGTQEGTGISQHEEEERKRKERIKERRRRAGLEEATAVRSSASTFSAAPISSSVRSRARGNGDSTIHELERGHQRGEDYGHGNVSGSSVTRRRSQKLVSGTPKPTYTQTGSQRTSSPDHFELASSLHFTESDTDTLAYLHHVKPTDTLEGVAIRFNIHPSSLRKANRLWPGDRIQYRRELFLPVDECLAKGRPLPQGDLRTCADSDPQKRRTPGKRKGMDDIQLEGSSKSKGRRKLSIDSNSNALLSLSNDSNETLNIHTSDCENRDRLSALPPSTFNTRDLPVEDASEHLYKHESYTCIDNIGVVEIVRLPRKKLSHFPPRRKKPTSQSAVTDIPNLLDSSSLSEAQLSVFSSSSPTNRISDAYATSEDITNFSQMLKQVATETLEGVETVGSVVEGYIRKFKAKVEDFVGDVSQGDLIELTVQGLRQGNGDGNGSGGGVGINDITNARDREDNEMGSIRLERGRSGRSSRVPSTTRSGNGSRGSSSLRERVRTGPPTSKRRSGEGGLKSD